MKFSGLQKISLIDYPDRVASVLFTPGCNLRCPFCHNWRIVTDPKPPFLQETHALEILQNRRKYVDAVVVTGGEPTMHKELPKFLEKLKARGFSVKLDTNGFYPDVLEQCLESVDYVAMDLKTCPNKYKLLGAKDTVCLMKSIEILKMGKVPYEFRTTTVPELVTNEDVICMGEIVKGASMYAFQQFVPKDTLDKHFESLQPYSEKSISDLADVMKKYVVNTLLRL